MPMLNPGINQPGFYWLYLYKVNKVKFFFSFGGSYLRVLLLTISQQKALTLQSFFEFINLLIENMTKAEIVAEISAKTGLEKQVVLTVVESMMDTIKTSMINGNEVFLRGFGSFIIKHRAEKTARNISKNTTIIIPAHNIPAFKPAKEFMAKVK